MTLETVPFGTTDMKITRVGFGAWAIGGGGWAMGWGRQDDQESIDAIRHAVDVGINWVDTAAVYGLGHSEEVVGRAVKGMAEADRPYLFTKCGLVWDPDNPSVRATRVGRPDQIRRGCEDSLRRLGVERIDLLQMHWPPADDSPPADYWGALLELKAEGKAAAIGLSNHSVAQLAEVEALGHVDSLQPPFSAINRTAGGAEIPWCEEHRTGVIVYSPMQSGLLTGAFSRQRVAALPDDDWRSRSADFTDHLDANLAVADALKPIAAERGATQAEVAIAWTLAWPGVTGASAGARRPDQIDGWLGAAGLTLDAADVAAIAAAIESSGAGSGPRSPGA